MIEQLVYHLKYIPLSYWDAFLITPKIPRIFLSKPAKKFKECVKRDFFLQDYSTNRKLIISDIDLLYMEILFVLNPCPKRLIPDTTNLVKVLEDAVAEYYGISDKNIVSSKVYRRFAKSSFLPDQIVEFCPGYKPRACKGNTHLILGKAQGSGIVSDFLLKKFLVS